MGYWKHNYDNSQQDLDYKFPDRYACPDCVTDSYLASILAAKLEDEPCSYCGAAQAADISFLLDEMKETILLGYTDPAEQLPYESREGGYQGEVLSAQQIVYEFDPWTECDQLLDDVASAFDQGSFWCKRDYFGLSHYEMLDYSWDDFSEQVKHRTRYLFLQELNTDREYSDQIPPREMLDVLGDIFKEFELFHELPQAADLFRVRVVDASVHPATAADLGTPPREAAKFPNRMSPAGIPMFYAGLDEVTAILETYDPIADKGRKIALARFRSNRPLTLLDLTSLPAVPSMFDSRQRNERPRVEFLRSFEDDFTKPVDKDTEAHTEYVPTQIVTEFVRHRLRTPGDEPVDGILYRSSRTRTSTAVVIFADQKHCGPRNHRERFDPEPFLDLIDWRYVTYEESMKSRSDSEPT
jgi:hypothetical protein